MDRNHMRSSQMTPYLKAYVIACLNACSVLEELTVSIHMRCETFVEEAETRQPSTNLCQWGCYAEFRDLYMVQAFPHDNVAAKVACSARSLCGKRDGAPSQTGAYSSECHGSPI